MRVRLSILLAIFALAAGFALARASPDASRPTPVPIDPPPAATEVTGTTVALPELATSPAPADAITYESLDDLIARVPIHDLTPVDLPIAGIVVDAGGRPLAGARVRAWPMYRFYHRELVHEVRSMAIAERYRERYLVSAESDASGHFELTGIHLFPYKVECELGDRKFVVPSTLRMSVGPGSWLEIRARDQEEIDARAEDEGIAVSVSVLLPDGKSATEATIRIAGRRRRGTRSWVWTDPKIALPAGQHTLTATVDDVYVSGPIPVTVAPGPPPAPVVFQTVERDVVRVHVVYPPGSDRQANELLIMAVEPSRLPTDLQMRHAGRSVMRKGNSDVIVATDVPPGDYLISIGQWQRSSWGRMVIDHAGGITDIEFVLPEPSGDDGLRVRVLDPSGEPASQLSFAVRYSVGGGSGHTGLSARRRSDGTYVLDISSASRIEPFVRGEADGQVTLLVSHREYGTLSIDVPGGARGTLEAAYTAVATLDLRLSNLPDRDLYPLVHVQLARTSDNLQQLSVAISRKMLASRVVLGPTPSGELDIVITSGREYAPNPVVLLRETVVLEAGDNEVLLELPDLHPVTIEVLGRGWFAQRLVLGGVVIGELHLHSVNDLVLPAGRYTLEASHRFPGLAGTSPVSFTVPADGPVRVGQPEEGRR